MKYGWNNLWTTIEIKCPWCGAIQMVDTAIPSCFYCHKEIWVTVEGKVVIPWFT